MFENSWDVLLVDDEPDVLSVSKLAMKKMKVFGLPLRIHTAQSKEDGLEIIRDEFSSPKGKACSLAVAIIDVVMETDTAGLDLCQTIREEQHNYLTQIFVRTGQPGIAPERDVIDRYNISGYISKQEATEDKLYSILKTGINQYYFSSVALWLSNALSSFIDAAGSKDKMKSAISDSLLEFHTNRKGELIKSYDIKIALLFNGNVMAINMDESESGFSEEKDKFASQDAIPLSENGDTLRVLDNSKLLISIAPQSNRCGVDCIAIGGYQVPDYVVKSHYLWLKAIGSHWKIL